MMASRGLVGVLIAIAALMVVVIFDVGKLLGAHPFWSTQTVWIGLVVGLGLALILRFLLGKPVRVVIFALLAIGAFGLAYYGKTQFAASYAEDALAGKFWYFGWMGAWAGVAGFIATAIGR